MASKVAIFWANNFVKSPYLDNSFDARQLRVVARSEARERYSKRETKQTCSCGDVLKTRTAAAMATEALLPDRAAREKIQSSIAVAAATSAGERRRVEEEEKEGTTEEEAQESAWREEEEEVVVEMSVGSSGGGGWRQYRVVRWGRNKVYEPLLIILRRYLLSFPHCIRGGEQKGQADSSSVLFLFLFLSSSTAIPLKFSSLFRFFPPEERGLRLAVVLWFLL